MRRDNKGFSLIELSIVLIIMGLLVAGVTGGASLIKSAQMRSVVNEFTNYRTAYNTYYAQFGEVPGADTDPNVIADDNAAFTALFEEGIIDKEPITEGEGTANYISSKFGKNTKWFLNNAEAGFKITPYVGLNVLSLSGSADYATGTLTGDEAISIEEKIDDGSGSTGLVRGLKSDTAAGEGETYTEDDATRQYSLVSKLDF